MELVQHVNSLKIVRALFEIIQNHVDDERLLVLTIAPITEDLKDLLLMINLQQIFKVPKTNFKKIEILLHSFLLLELFHEIRQNSFQCITVFSVVSLFLSVKTNFLEIVTWLARSLFPAKISIGRNFLDKH